MVIEAYHLCMMMRGVEKQNSKTITSAVRGRFRSDNRTREEFLRLVCAAVHSEPGLSRAVLLELSEVLPARVRAATGHGGRRPRVRRDRVTRGFGCPTCDARFSDRGKGVVDLEEEMGEPPGAGRFPPVRTGRGCPRWSGPCSTWPGSGHVLLGPGLAGIAAAVGSLAERWEVVFARGPPGRGSSGSDRISRDVTAGGGRLPLLRGRFGAAARPAIRARTEVATSRRRSFHSPDSPIVAPGMERRQRDAGGADRVDRGG